MSVQDNKQENRQQENKVQTDNRQEVTERKNKKYINMQQNNGSIERVEYFPAPRYHASESVTRNAVRSNEMSRSKDKHTLPHSASGKMETTWQPIPSGGIAALADSTFPDDSDNDEKMDQHIFDIMTLNRDIIRDDSSYTVGTLVRVPKV